MMRLFFSSLLWMLTLILPFSGFAQKQFSTEDRIYDRNIKTVLLYPLNPVQDQQGAFNNNNLATGTAPKLFPPIVKLGGSNLILEFDDLSYDYKNFYVKIINCNADWTPSDLSSIQYLDDYNEYFISDRRISEGTRIAYVHYKFVLPRIKLSGNYVVKVYKDYNEDDFIISRRFSIYETTVDITANVNFSADPSARNTHQQVDFAINYNRIQDVMNPAQNLKVFLRQNHRWDKAITGLKPATFDEQRKRMEFFFFNRENNFKGENEFRFFEATSNLYTGRNTAKLLKDSMRAYVHLYSDKSTGQLAYTQPLMADLDGKYFPYNEDNNDSEFMADYVYVNFTLDHPTPVNGKVYVLGAMTDWRLNKSFEMVYNAETKKYHCEVLMKQGVYNYRYVLTDPTTWALNETYFEGNHSETQNTYDILVYYRPIGSRSERLIGYYNTVFLGRR